MSMTSVNCRSVPLRVLCLSPLAPFPCLLISRVRVSASCAARQHKAHVSRVLTAGSLLLADSLSFVLYSILFIFYFILFCFCFIYSFLADYLPSSMNTWLTPQLWCSHRRQYPLVLTNSTPSSSPLADVLVGGCFDRGILSVCSYCFLGTHTQRRRDTVSNREWRARCTFPTTICPDFWWNYH